MLYETNTPKTHTSLNRCIYFNSRCRLHLVHLFERVEDTEMNNLLFYFKFFFMKNEILTLQDLKEMKPAEIIASGKIENSPDGLFMSTSKVGNKLIWVAKRGGIHDWAIYTYWAEYGLQYALEHGDKVTSKNNIKKLVPCDDEAFSMYRY